MRNSELINLCHCINQNIERYGLERYDLRDTRWIPVLLKKNIVSSVLRKTVLLIEEFFPITLRKILKVEKKIWPTTYTFLGNAYFLAEKNNININSKYTSTQIADMLLMQYVNTKNQEKWWNDNPHIGFDNATFDVGNKTPTLLMHALTRCNILLLTLGKYYEKPLYIDIGVKSAKVALKQYYIIDFKDGTKSISYFYNTKDCTININSEFAHWLSLIPYEMHTEQTIDMLYSIIRLLIKEQNTDGSWYYFSKWHMKEYSEQPSCDCHHTGTVLYNIINILKCNYIKGESRDSLISALNKGMEFYINAFFDFETGNAKTLIKYKRPAGPVQYSEAIFSFCEYLTLEIEHDKTLWNKVKRLLPKVLDQNVNLVNIKNGAAPSEKIIKWKHLNSIRWGNGPILQAIISYLSIYPEIYGNEQKE